ncbi:PAS domain S-box protein [Thermodesulfobacteriota bacterium]
MADKSTYEELGQRGKKLEKAESGRSRAEKALQESEEKYRQLFNTVSDSVLVFDAETREFTDVNNAATTLYGYSKEEFFKLKHSDITCEPKKSDESIKQTISGEIQRIPLRYHKKKDGTKFPVEISSGAFKLGNRQMVCGVVRDITDRMEIEQALQVRTDELEERLKELNCLYGISNLVEQQYISLEEILQGTVDLIPPSWQYPEITCARIIIQDREWKTKNFRETIWKQVGDIKVHGELSGNLEVYYLEEKPEIHEGPFHREERNLINAITRLTGRIVERKQGEEALRASEDKYRSIFENIQDVYYEVTLDGKILEISPSIEEVSIYKREAIIGHSLYDIYVDPKKREEFVKELLKNGKVTNYEILLKDKDDSQGYCSVTAKLVRDKHGNPIKIIGSMHNITERKQAEEQIHALTQELMKAQENERQMISCYLHDNMAQNLSALIIDCETLLDNQPSIRPEIRQKVSEMSKMLRECIKEVRNLSYDLRPPVLDELGLVQALFQYCDDFSEDNGINVDFHSAGMKDLKLDFDIEINLYRLIQEGLVNIKKHAAASHVTIRLVAAFPNIILRIDDDGIGFDVQKRMATITKEKRMGIRSMEERAKLLKGEMEIQSKPDQGTKISIKFPYKGKKHGS